MSSSSWLDIGEEAKAEELFYRSYQPYVRQPFKVWTEKQFSVGAVNFITGAAGFLQVKHTCPTLKSNTNPFNIFFIFEVS
jgi:hypothetical protein